MSKRNHNVFRTEAIEGLWWVALKLLTGLDTLLTFIIRTVDKSFKGYSHLVVKAMGWVNTRLLAAKANQRAANRQKRAYDKRLIEWGKIQPMPMFEDLDDYKHLVINKIKSDYKIKVRKGI